MNREAAALRLRFDRAHRSLRTAAVTGTNGKTTTTSMIEAIVAAAGEPAARLTTLGARVCGQPITGATATDEFLHTVERAVEVGVRTLALEVTSKALVKGIARRWPPHVAVFTNLSRDHLDMHGSAEAYLAAKAQLFLALPDRGTAVLNADDPSSALIAELIANRDVTLRWFTTAPDPLPRGGGGGAIDLAASSVVTSATGTRIDLAPGPLADRLGGSLALAVTGDVHAQNALAAALAADTLGYPAEAIAAGLAAFAGVPGRFQIIGRTPLVVVDYAHTPDGLRGTLETARALVPEGGRLVCVFGCGGNRDQGKRPEMGAVADRLADRVVLTSDNPRHEPPQAIADAVRAGAPEPRASWIEELDRRAAIDRAVAEATRDDVVIIAGKGHEEVQEIGADERPFSDAEVAAAAIARRP